MNKLQSDYDKFNDRQKAAFNYLTEMIQSGNPFDEIKDVMILLHKTSGLDGYCTMFEFIAVCFAEEHQTSS